LRRDSWRRAILDLRLRLWSRRGHRIDLAFGEIAEFAGTQLSELEWTHAHAHKACHLQSHRDAHAAHLALPTGEQHQRDS